MPESEQMSLLGDRIRTVREARGWSMNELARRAGISEPTVSRIETGETPAPTHSTVQKIARALQVPYTELLGGPAPRVEAAAAGSAPVLAHFDLAILAAVEQAIDDFLAAHQLRIGGTKRAQVVAFLYEYVEKAGPDDNAFQRFLALALGK